MSSFVLTNGVSCVQFKIMFILYFHNIILFFLNSKKISHTTFILSNTGDCFSSWYYMFAAVWSRERNHWWPLLIPFFKSKIIIHNVHTYYSFYINEIYLNPSSFFLHQQLFCCKLIIFVNDVWPKWSKWRFLFLA